MIQVKRMSKWLRRLTGAILQLIILGWLIITASAFFGVTEPIRKALITSTTLELAGKSDLIQAAEPGMILNKLLFYGLFFIPFCAGVFYCLLFYELFALYEQGKTLTPKNVRILFWIAILTIFNPLLNLGYETGLLIWLHADLLNTAAYHHVVADSIAWSFSGLVLLIIAYVMQESLRFKDEVDQTI